MPSLVVPIRVQDPAKDPDGEGFELKIKISLRALLVLTASIQLVLAPLLAIITRYVGTAYLW